MAHERSRDWLSDEMEENGMTATKQCKKLVFVMSLPDLQTSNLTK